MTTKHELWLTTDAGSRLSLLDEAESFDWSHVANGPGRCRVTLPGSFDRSLLIADNRIEIWRTPESDAKLRLENVYFIRRITPMTTLSGLDRIVVRGLDPTELLTRRIIAYDSGTSEAEKTDLADDMMKEIVTENLGVSAGVDSFGASRSFDSSFFSVQPDAGLGPSLTKSFARRNVLSTLQDLANAAREAGTEIFFAVVPTSTLTFEFQTFLDQPGQDRRFPSGSIPAVFSLLRGNIEDPFLEDDFEDEVSFVYAGGQGEAAARVIEEARDLDRINASIWNRREGFKDARNEGTPAGVADDADAALTKGLPRRRFSAKLLNSEDARYGRDWNFGDRVTVEYIDEQFDGLVRAVVIAVDSDGKETVTGKVEVSDVAS